jgi:DNA invertase Pin-like site-specific DNA recombinase
LLWHHLFVGTHTDNMRDCVSKGRLRSVPPKLIGSQVGASKLCDDDVRTIRRIVAAGQSMQAVADRFGVNYKTVYRIVRGQQWTHVD